VSLTKRQSIITFTHMNSSSDDETVHDDSQLIISFLPGACSTVSPQNSNSVVQDVCCYKGQFILLSKAGLK
jgi:hypothetical protein